MSVFGLYPDDARHLLQEYGWAADARPAAQIAAVVGAAMVSLRSVGRAP
ncbi:hypothetical protein [Streptomyces cavernae]|nr:hypothetical protein [Streptomyces cavernae]